MTNKINKNQRGYCIQCHRRTRHHSSSGEWLCTLCEMALEDKLTERQEDILRLLDKSSLSGQEIQQLLKTKRPHQVRPTHHHNFGKKRIRIGVVSDLHIGSKYFDEGAFDYCVERFNKEGVDAIYFPGDIIEGMSGRDGQIYELDEIGVTRQVDKAVRLLRKFKQPFYFILGNHDLWAQNKANQGTHIGEDVERRVEQAHYLGDMEATVDIGEGVKLKLTHRGSSSTYALSYSGQRMINNIPSKEKPNIILNGHLHKQIYMQYRDVHYVESGTLQRQTEFMKMKGAPANVGFWVVDIEFGKGRVTAFRPTWYSCE